MKILQLSYSLSSGGGERFVVDLSNRLAKEPQNEVVLLNTDDERIPKNMHYRTDVSSRVRYINLHCKSGLSLMAFWRVFKVIMKEKPDIVHANCNLLLIAIPSLILRHSKYVQTLHNVAQACVQKKWLKGVYHWFYNHTIQPVTISKTCQQSYVNFYGDAKSICITNGRERLVPLNKVPDDVKFLQDAKEPVFIHVARCAKQKNQNRLFMSFDKLQAEGFKFQLIVLGSGYENKWMPLYKDNKQIHILGERKNVADYMNLADYFVLSSDYEGLPLTLLEAMSLGVVPVCTPAGGVVDVIDDGKNGYVTSSFSNEEFYEKIKAILKRRETLDRKLIKTVYESTYSMKVCAQKYYELYNSLLNR